VIQRSSFCTRIAPLASAAILATAACGGHTSAPRDAQPDADAKQTMTSFMRAVSDSNLTKIAELWGSSKGSAAATRQPADYERRIVLIQSYLRHDQYRIIADAADGNDSRSMQIELRREACTWTVPFTVTKAGKAGWLVSNIDLTRAGNPVRPCDPKTQGDSTTRKP
jgi:hypothetical protein